MYGFHARIFFSYAPRPDLTINMFISAVNLGIYENPVVLLVNLIVCGNPSAKTDSTNTCRF